MRVSAIFAFVVAILFAQKIQADSCFVPSGNNVALSKGCTSGKATIFSKMDEFTVKIDADKGEPKEWSGSLAFEGCQMKLDLNRGSARSTLYVDGAPFNLPATATIKKGSASISNDRMPLFALPASCSPNFKQAGSGNTIDVSYSMGPADSPLSMLFNEVSIYSNDVNDGSSGVGAKAGIIIGVLVIAFLFCLLVGGGFLFFRRWKKQARLAKEKEEPEKKKDERKKTKDELDKTQDELDKTQEELEKKKDEPEKKKDETEKPEVKKKDAPEKSEVKKKDAPEKSEVKKKEPIIKQVDETKPKGLKDTPDFKHIVAQKQRPLPPDDWTLDRDATRKPGPVHTFINGFEYVPRKNRQVSESSEEVPPAPLPSISVSDDRAEHIEHIEHIEKMKRQLAKRIRSQKSKKSQSSKPKKDAIEEENVPGFVEPQDTPNAQNPYQVTEKARRIANMISPPKDNYNHN